MKQTGMDYDAHVQVRPSHFLESIFCADTKLLYKPENVSSAAFLFKWPPFALMFPGCFGSVLSPKARVSSGRHSTQYFPLLFR